MNHLSRYFIGQLAERRNLRVLRFEPSSSPETKGTIYVEQIEPSSSPEADIEGLAAEVNVGRDKVRIVLDKRT